MAKALQRQLQPLISKIIHEDRTGFFQLRCILDNVLLQHEIIEWAWESRQDMLLLKLDFRKAYNTVSLSIFFQAMDKLGILIEYIAMTKILFKDTYVSVCLNGKASPSFSIGRGIRQGYPLALFLFHFVGEAFHAASMKEVHTRTLRGISLPGGTSQQLLI